MECWHLYHHGSEYVRDEGSPAGRILLSELLPVPGVGRHGPGAEEHEREGGEPEAGRALYACAVAQPLQDLPGVVRTRDQGEQAAPGDPVLGRCARLVTAETSEDGVTLDVDGHARDEHQESKQSEEAELRLVTGDDGV